MIACSVCSVVVWCLIWTWLNTQRPTCEFPYRVIPAHRSQPCERKASFLFYAHPRIHRVCRLLGSVGRWGAPRRVYRAPPIHLPDSTTNRLSALVAYGRSTGQVLTSTPNPHNSLSSSPIPLSNAIHSRRHHHPQQDPEVEESEPLRSFVPTIQNFETRTPVAVSPAPSMWFIVPSQPPAPRDLLPPLGRTFRHTECANRGRV